MASDPGNKAPPARGGSIEEAIANGFALLDRDASVALLQAQTILRSDRMCVPALYLAAAAHRRLGEDDAAGEAEEAALQVSGRDPDLKRIADTVAAGRHDEASRLAQDRLTRAPGDIVATTLAAEADLATGRPERAVTLLAEVRRRAPRFLPAEALYLRALLALDRLDELDRELQKRLALQPDDLTALKLAARVASDRQDFARAVQLGARIVALQPGEAQNWTGYGESLRFAGRKPDAADAFRRALEVDPLYGHAWWHLATLDVGALGDGDLAAMLTALDRVGDRIADRTNLEFAIGLLLDHRGDHAAAYEHLARGNALRREAYPHDAQELTRQVTAYLERTPASAIPARRQAPDSAKVPIFIVGMPRSGSTLLERALGRHSQIETLGELPLVPHFVEGLARQQCVGGVEKAVASLSQGELADLADRYLAGARERMASDSRFFVDKLHMNWRYLPLILRMLPSAVVIDIRRDAMDCCWSNLKTLFALGHTAASDQSSIAQFYRDYVRMTDTLRERAPGRIHFLRYESLVEDFEGELRRSFDHIGVPFEGAALEFHRSSAPVATASSEQVRQPLNRKGLGVAAPYQQWLGELEAKLGALAKG